jgi:hypothetical protein
MISWNSRRDPGESDRSAPATSEVPAAESAPLRESVVPYEGVAGGVDNLPEDLLPPDEQLLDELNHAGLDEVLPGEDRAPRG